jgi:hypothetical protein
MLWKDPNVEPSICVIGVPHLSLSQIYDATERISKALEKPGSIRFGCAPRWPRRHWSLQSSRKTRLRTWNNRRIVAIDQLGWDFLNYV